MFENEVTRVTHTALNGLVVCLMVLDITFNNILAISWRSVLLVGETRVPQKKMKKNKNKNNALQDTKQKTKD
jgi:hypothetical protein